MKIFEPGTEAVAAPDRSSSAGSAASVHANPAKPLPWWRRAMPFALSLVLLGFVASRLSWQAFLLAMGRTHFVGFVAFAAAFNVALLFSDSLATTHVYRRVICPVRYLEFLTIRGASYLPSLVNHHVGQGWLTFFFSKVYRAPLWRVAGATLLVYATTFGCLYLFEVGALLVDVDRARWLLPILAAVGGAGLVYLALIFKKPSFLLRRQATAPLVEVGVRGHLLALVYRAPHVAVLFFGTWLSFDFFAVNVPFEDALALIPPLMFVAALPLTPQGVGTRDALALQLLTPFASGTPEEAAASIAAATLSWACALTLVQAVGSPLLMRRALRLLERGTG